MDKEKEKEKKEVCLLIDRRKYILFVYYRYLTESKSFYLL